MSDLATVKDTIKSYILGEFLPEEDPEELTDSTELMTLGILDSVSIMQLVTFMEDTFGITFEASEVGIDYMNTLDDMARLVISKA